MKYCVENHDCGQSLFVPRKEESHPWSGFSNGVDNKSAVYPTRLLDLQAVIEDCLDIRLMESPASASPYATLSHYWGLNPYTSYQATTSTLRDLGDRIPYAGLPKTYRDAISVCRSLIIRYLWVDSLCIIQDS